MAIAELAVADELGDGADAGVKIALVLLSLLGLGGLFRYSFNGFRESIGRLGLGGVVQGEDQRWLGGRIVLDHVEGVESHGAVGRGGMDDLGSQGGWSQALLFGVDSS